MANNIIPTFLFMIPIIIIIFSFTCFPSSSQALDVEGMFVFGSSLVDNGNNNYLRNSSARADYVPYGIDFPLGPSGRFSNGRNPIDVLGELLKLPSFIPPFSDPATNGDRIAHGVNFASGGSGILDDTGSITGEVTGMNQQIRNFEKVTLAEMGGLFDLKKNSDYLSKYLFVVGTGGNDYFLNYFTSKKKTTPLLTFTHSLIATLSCQLKVIYIYIYIHCVFLYLLNNYTLKNYIYFYFIIRI
ncbi:putative triacylglycerol lipase [Dioscorea sansibarensis]